MTIRGKKSTIVACALVLFMIGGPAGADGVFVPLPDPYPKACKTYTGVARRFRIPLLEDLEVFEVADKKGDGRTFSLERANSGDVAPIGSVGSWGANMTPSVGYTSWVGIDRGFYLVLKTAEKGRLSFRYCVTRVD